MQLPLVLSVCVMVSATGLQVGAEKRDSEKRGTSAEFGILDLLFKFGDTNKSDTLDFAEVRELFRSRLFAATGNDVTWTIMSRVSDKSNTLDRDEWRKVSFTAEEIQDLTKPFEEIPMLS